MKSIVVDDFSDAASWLPVASGEASQKLTSEPGDHGTALRMDFDFKGGGGFIGARKEFSRSLPEAYTFSFRVRGSAPRNKLEFKLADPSSKNVWRWQEESFEFGPEARAIGLKNSRIDFAWGPAGGGTLRKLGAVEFIISAGPGGRGTIWLEDFRIEDRTSRKEALVTASKSAKGADPQSILGRGKAAGWRSAPGDDRPWLQLDFHQAREYGGLIVEWAPLPAKRAFDVQASDDGSRWRVIHRARSAEGARSFIYLPKGSPVF